MKLPLLLASLLTTALAVATAAPLTRAVDFCDEPARLVLEVAAQADAEELNKRLATLDTPVCVRRGPQASAYLLKARTAMDVGVIPFGSSSALLVQRPRFFSPQLTARVESKN